MRQQFDTEFDFLGFNTALVSEYCSERTVIGFDPSYIPKSGKKTCGTGKYWSGCAGAPKWGLEISGIAAIDLDNHTAMHLEAVQTLPNEGESLLDFYANVLVSRKNDLQKTSHTIVSDAYFSKEPFVSKICNADFNLVSRLRDDARLTYLIESKPTGKKGRPKTVGGKVDTKNLDLNYFTEILVLCTKYEVKSENADEKIYTAIVKSVSLKRNVRVVVVQKIKNRKVVGAKIYFSTDIKMSAAEILEIYSTRFQIEFLYRDAKQHTGLANCQARIERNCIFTAICRSLPSLLPKRFIGYQPQKRNEKHSLWQMSKQ